MKLFKFPEKEQKKLSFSLTSLIRKVKGIFKCDFERAYKITTVTLLEQLKKKHPNIEFNILLVKDKIKEEVSVLGVVY